MSNTESTTPKIKYENRLSEFARIYRKPSQSITVLPADDTDLSMPLGDLIQQGFDVRVLGMSGSVRMVNTQNKANETAKIRIDHSQKFVRFYATLKDGAEIDLSKVDILLGVDYSNLFKINKSEDFGRNYDIPDVGELSADSTTHYEKLTPEERYAWLNQHLVYLNKLKIQHKLELDKLIYRYERAKKPLYDNRHLLLSSRLDLVNGNIEQIKAWTKDNLLKLAKLDSLPDDYKETLINVSSN